MHITICPSELVARYWMQLTLLPAPSHGFLTFHQTAVYARVRAEKSTSSAPGPEPPPKPDGNRYWITFGGDPGRELPWFWMVRLPAVFQATCQLPALRALNESTVTMVPPGGSFGPTEKRGPS